MGIAREIIKIVILIWSFQLKLSELQVTGSREGSATMNIFLHTMILSYFINQIFNIEEVGVAKSVVAKSELCGVYNK